jgi:hypothetical protein
MIGSSWVKSLAALIVVLLTIWILLYALNDAEESAEALVVELTVRNMQIGLDIALAEEIMAGRRPRSSMWNGMNPVGQLASVPSGYVGECPVNDSADPGAWCFVTKLGELRYYPRNGRHLQISGESGHLRSLGWRVRAGKAGDDPRLEAVAPYRWRVEKTYIKP